MIEAKLSYLLTLVITLEKIVKSFKKTFLLQKTFPPKRFLRVCNPFIRVEANEFFSLNFLTPFLCVPSPRLIVLKSLSTFLIQPKLIDSIF